MTALYSYLVSIAAGSVSRIGPRWADQACSCAPAVLRRLETVNQVIEVVWSQEDTSSIGTTGSHGSCTL